MLRSPEGKRDLLISLLLVLAIVMVYWQVQGFKFVYYDDGEYVNERAHVLAGLTWEGLRWALTATEAGFWHPLTWLSLMVDRELFGNNPGGFHWTNVLLHIANTLILYLFLKRATASPWKSAMVSALFAVHPLHAESVAWVSQRKDLLCTLFGFSALSAYVRYAESPGLGRYSLVAAFFILGLMSKPMVVTFPFVMLLMDFWPLQRFPVKSRVGGGETPADIRYSNLQKAWALLLEKIPLMVLSVLASVLVVITEKKITALTSLQILSIPDRLANGVVSYVKYIGMMFWPVNLTFFYPHPVTTPLLQSLCALVVLLAVTVAVVFAVRRKPYIFTGWFWYTGTLVPVIGLIQVGPHAMADRYTYVPLIGLSIVLVWGAADLIGRWRIGRPLGWAVGVAVIAGLSACCWAQVGYWRNTVTLFEHALKVAPDNYIALNNLGQFYVNTGEYDRGMALMKKSIQVKPEIGALYYSYGVVLRNRGEYGQALGYFLKAEQLSYKNTESSRMLGDCYRETGKKDLAADAYTKALSVDKRNLNARFGLGLTYADMGRDEEAIRELREALSLDPRHPGARKMLMLLSLKKGDGHTVIEEGRKALALDASDQEVVRMMNAARGAK